jgi:chaperone modulatory protein CbpM
MGHDIVTVVTGTVVDHEGGIPLATLCRACGLPVEAVAAMVEMGILEPVGGRRGHWRFPGESVRRARTAVRLQRDFELNLEGVALALDLLDRIEELRARLRSMDAQRPRRQVRRPRDRNR